MAINFLTKIFGSRNDRLLKKYRHTVGKINAMEADLEKLSDADLRAKTDAPMMECKKALTEADGDMAKAEELLRVKLGTKAGKAASRVVASLKAAALK